MKHVSIFFLLSLLGFLAGCSDELVVSETENLPEKGIVLKLTSGQLETKTHLYSQENLQHVKKVYAILYACGDMTTEVVDPQKATVVASQLLKKQNGTIWNPSNTTEAMQVDTFKLTLPDEQVATLPGKYLILCVGLDDASGDTYGLNYDENQKPAFAEKGAKLAAAQAVLQKMPEQAPTSYENDATENGNKLKQDKDLIAYGQPDMAHAELFAGWQTFDCMPDDLNVVEVELRRRVAGVFCYLSDIPYKLNIGNKPYRITQVRLNLFQEQNAQIGLMRDVTFDGKPSAIDFGQPVDGKSVCQTICQFDLMSFTEQANNSSGEPLYRIPTAHLTGRKQQENTILMGAYLLPVLNNGPGATFEVQLLGHEYDDSPDNPGHIVPGSELEVVKSFPAIFEEKGADQTVYSIYPNMIYHIGHKLYKDNTEGDYPESLSGTKLTVVVDSCSRVDVPVDFPNVPIVPMLELKDSIGQVIKTEPTVPGEPYYIFDSEGVEMSVQVLSSILYQHWRLSVVNPGQSDDTGISFRNEKGEYVTSLDGEGSIDIVIRLSDYASVADWQAKKDKRRIQLKIESLELLDDGTKKVVPNMFATLWVEQYNALIVKMEDGHGYRGFCRYDYGVERSLVTGKPIKTCKLIQWGYFNSVVVTEHWSDGQANYMEFLGYWVKYFEGSAVQVVGLGKYGQKVDYLNKEKPHWFLPSINGMMALLRQYGDDPDAHLPRDEFYWSSNSASFLTKALATKIEPGGYVDKDYYRPYKKNEFRARRACHAN